MTLEILERDMKHAWKEGDMQRKTALANMIDAVKKASMTNKGRIEITEQLVDETLVKYQKTVQEQYDTCPATPEYMTRRLAYCNELNIVKEYAPQMITDPEKIEGMIKSIAENDPKMALSKANRGYVMKTLTSQLKGKADMSIVNKVVGELLV
ncbi:MAG: GatB/YqeY domain-containing protein [Lachnospiraceae bacterium]|nr:GatB/YqeY domain-containing protein [Lachnospiraceae bacterium]